MSRPMLMRVFHWAPEATSAAVGPSEMQPTMDSSTYSNLIYSSRVMSRCSRELNKITHKQNRVI